MHVGCIGRQILVLTHIPKHIVSVVHKQKKEKDSPVNVSTFNV